MVQDAASSFNNHMMLFNKDRNFISDNNYFCFYHSLFLNWLFPSKTEIQRLRSKLNKYLMENWQVKEVWVMSMVSILGGSIVFSNHGGQNIFAVKPIRLSQFDTQSRYSVFPTIFWKGSEKIARSLLESTFNVVKEVMQAGGHSYILPVAHGTHPLGAILLAFVTFI